jgi:hypothetical protein
VIHRCASLVDGRLAVRSVRWTRKPKTAQKRAKEIEESKQAQIEDIKRATRSQKVSFKKELN